MTNNIEQKKPAATLDDALMVLEQNQEILEEIKTWMRIDGVEKVQGLLTKHLDTPEKIMVYHLSDGKSTREIGTMCNLDQKTVSNYWKVWNKLGLMKTEKVRGGGYRHIRAFDPEDYGIKIPTIPKSQLTKEPHEHKSATERPKAEVDVT